MNFHGTGPDLSDSRKLEEIFIEFSDKPHANNPIDLQIVIEGVDLRRFIFHLIDEGNNN